MLVRQQLNKFINFLDNKLLFFTREQPHIIILYFHKIYQSKSEALNGLSLPMEASTAEDLAIAIETLLAGGYTFINPNQLLLPEHLPKKSALITFDDGYFNNTRALPVLERLQTPALFNISTWYVAENRSFWVDVLYRRLWALGKSHEEITRIIEEFKLLPTFSDVITRIGEDAMAVYSDNCRPFTPDELRDFGAHPLVYIGNHTHTHAALALQSEARIKEELQTSQQLLEEWLGYQPPFIAYPHGSMNRTVMEIAAQQGFQLGLTVEQMKNYFPIENMLFVHRFNFSDPYTDIAAACRHIIRKRHDQAIIRQFLSRFR
jgi:peptidoglycan/xylan/chitin deacetylase (PgdA/CDA1 family)